MFPNLKGKRLYSILNSKCPRCHEGDFHLTKKTYDLKNFGKNHERCSECDYRFEKEPGFFYGAMYVSYGLSIAVSVAVGVAILVLYPSASYKVYLAAILGGIVGLMPVTFRLSRVIWMNLFQHFDANALQNKSDKTI
ncbi:MAG: DUF983 domain-containing protein [Crocinitomix sp.]|nr:DUF983 domain-containing protein [Crocinitomix sp.]